MEQKGVLVSPVLHKTFWYSESNQLAALRGKFTDWLKALAGTRLKAILEQMQAFAPAIHGANYRQMMEQAEQLPQESQTAMQWYGKVWNVK